MIGFIFGLFLFLETKGCTVEQLNDMLSMRNQAHAICS